MNRVALLGNATCPLFFRGVDRLLRADGVEGTDDTLAAGEGARAQGIGVVSRLDSSREPWRGRVARASGVAEEDEGIAARADTRELLASWA